MGRLDERLKKIENVIEKDQTEKRARPRREKEEIVEQFN